MWGAPGGPGGVEIGRGLCRVGSRPSCLCLELKVTISGPVSGRGGLRPRGVHRDPTRRPRRGREGHVPRWEPRQLGLSLGALGLGGSCVLGVPDSPVSPPGGANLLMVEK